MTGLYLASMVSVPTTPPPGLDLSKLYVENLRLSRVPVVNESRTDAGGWTILNCNENALTQDIRLVCTGTPQECDHLYDNTGPAGKLVRLPENCGGNAFARIHRNWVHEDQSLPVDVTKLLQKRDGTLPQVQGLTLDTNFDAIDPAQNGEVNLAVKGANVPGAIGNFHIGTPASLQTRGLFDFNQEQTKTLPPIELDKTFNIFDLSISCPAQGPIPAFDASLKADAAAKTRANVSIGVVAVGTIIPPNLSELSLFSNLDADTVGTLRLVGSADVTTDSGRKTLFEMGVPGLDFKGILAIGPRFQINAQAKATMEIKADIDVTLAYSVKGAKFTFPPRDDSEKPGGQFEPADSPLKISVAPSVSSKVVLEAHLIPTLLLGIDVLKQGANIFLDLDGSATVTMTLDANATASTDGTESGNVNGCIDVGSGFDVNAGADASFFGLFDKSTKVNLFSKKFQLFKKCLPGSNQRRYVPSRQPQRMSRRAAFLFSKRADLTCPTVSSGDVVSIVDEVLPAAG
ncbi:hypothetical protein AAF712_007026 [Marasmius tenuissimus]|uniref:DUF7223 domain-containing protein n=1 Tax=Marasmius tenuissimus TaxID=585030 RepID=A0ABR2ZWW6_9AGAR